MEEVLSLKSSALGNEHPETVKVNDKLTELLNVTAMSLIQKGERMDTALEMLKKAEARVRSLPMKAVTLNNLGCYYRKTGKLRASMGFLIEALATELKTESKSIADTHLNMCAVLSELNKHEDAIKHAMLAIIFLQDEFLKVALPAAAPEITEERLAVLAIAYHNLGV
jgi:tetratricopeptide (TPR) repeat protein